MIAPEGAVIREILRFAGAERAEDGGASHKEERARRK